MVKDIVIMSNNDTKLEEITVTGHSMNPRQPVITTTEIRQQDMGNSTQRSARKKYTSARSRNTRMPAPNVVMSCSMKLIMSATTMRAPPRYSWALSRYLSRMARTASVSRLSDSIVTACTVRKVCSADCNVAASFVVSPDSASFSLNRFRLFSSS